jgi:hypothetical protein
MLTSDLEETELVIATLYRGFQIRLVSIYERASICVRHKWSTVKTKAKVSILYYPNSYSSIHHCEVD